MAPIARKPWKSFAVRVWTKLDDIEDLALATLGWRLGPAATFTETTLSRGCLS